MAYMQFHIFRFNPERDDKSFFRDYEVEVQKGNTILDTLIKIKETQDPTLTFRYACRASICGSCGMRIQGKAMLACQNQVLEVAKDNKVQIEPLNNFRIIKDLILDFTEFIDCIKKIQPWLIRNCNNQIPEKEFIVYPDEKYHKLEELNNCILCGICNSECEVFKIDKHFIGPAAVIKSLRFTYDVRDGLGPIRINQLIEQGLHLCKKVEECEIKCPKDVPLCKEILKDMLIKE